MEPIRPPLKSAIASSISAAVFITNSGRARSVVRCVVILGVVVLGVVILGVVILKTPDSN